MSYWIYENWTAENKAKLHEGSCSFCNEGLGILLIEQLATVASVNLRREI
jgi:hypothetical protein